MSRHFYLYSSSYNVHCHKAALESSKPSDQKQTNKQNPVEQADGDCAKEKTLQEYKMNS